MRAKRMMREMLLFWRKHDKDEREHQKILDREAMIELKKQEDLR